LQYGRYGRSEKKILQGDVMMDIYTIHDAVEILEKCYDDVEKDCEGCSISDECEQMEAVARALLNKF
jgi:hypothetical protein